MSKNEFGALVTAIIGIFWFGLGLFVNIFWPSEYWICTVCAIFCLAWLFWFACFCHWSAQERNGENTSFIHRPAVVDLHAANARVPIKIDQFEASRAIAEAMRDYFGDKIEARRDLVGEWAKTYYPSAGARNGEDVVVSDFWLYLKETANTPEKQLALAVLQEEEGAINPLLDLLIEKGQTSEC